MGQKFVGQGARAGEAVFGKARGMRATQDRLKKVMQQIKELAAQIKEIETKLHQDEDGEDKEALRAELAQARR